MRKRGCERGGGQVHRTRTGFEFDPVCGKICAIIVPGPGKYMGIFCRDYEYCIPWVKIVKIGPDIILVNICESDMRRKLL